MSEKETILSCLRRAHWGPCSGLGCISIWESYDDDKKSDTELSITIEEKKEGHENKKIKIEYTYDHKENEIIIQNCGLHVAHDGPCNDPKCVFKLVC